MSFLHQQLFQFQERIKSVNSIRLPGLFKQPVLQGLRKRVGDATAQEMTATGKQLSDLHHAIKLIGTSASMDDYEKRKLGIFNQLNFFQLITGICIPLIGLFHNKKFPEWSWLVAMSPVVISMIVLWMNAKRKYDAALICYFIFYPVATSMVYMSGVHMGTELFFILYGILSVFFLHNIPQMLFSVSLSMISYFMLAVVWPDHRIQLQANNMFLYLFNQFAGIVFIFYGLYLIKKENIGYQNSVLAQKREISENAVLLQQQTHELTELNSLKNKLFSVIAHDLKTPMYSLRNLFRSIQQDDTPAKKIKAMLPDVINNLNYTTGLMDNLLHWAKSQMQSGGVTLQTLDITQLMEETVRLLQLQAAAKQLIVETSTNGPVLIRADKDMIDLVLRNLLSNAIKFTPPQGVIVMGVNEMASCAEIFVRDTGRGISAAALEKISRNDYFSTNGTAHEPGTGLGLMLCKEFLIKNGSQLFIESEMEKGSVFSFSLPVA